MKFKRTNNLNVRHTNDDQDCWITGCAALDDHRVVVVDSRNRSIKIVDVSTDTIKAYHKIQGYPWEVTCVDHSTIVVASTSGLLVFDDTLETKNQFVIEGVCQGIAFAYDRLFVGIRDPKPSIKCVDMQGKVLDTMRPSRDGKCVLWCPVFLTVTKEKKNIIISDDDSVISMKDYGWINFICKIENKQPKGVTVDDNDNIYVSGNKSDSIIMISADGETQKQVLNSEDGIKRPQSLTWCNGQLIVGCGNDYLSVYKPE